MSRPSEPSPTPRPPAFPTLRRVPEAIGDAILDHLAEARAGVAYVGGVLLLVGAAGARLLAWLLTRRVRLSGEALATQMVRVGVRSIPIILLVQVFIGIILALNLAPTLRDFGMVDSVADVVAIAMFRELGPLISAIVLTGFAGASIAAELGTMVEGEEIKALRAHALDPIRFLIVPRLVATTVMLVALTVIADLTGVLGGFLTAWQILGVDPQVYVDRTRDILTTGDYVTGLSKSAVFGLLIASIACYEGINVKGGAVGVGRATTSTVVKGIVSLIAADCVFTAVFYKMGW